MATILERIASELEKEGVKEHRHNYNYILDNKDEITDALHRYSKKLLWSVLIKEKKIDCKYIRFCQIINKIMPEFHRKHMSGQDTNY